MVLIGANHMYDSLALQVQRPCRLTKRRRARKTAGTTVARRAGSAVFVVLDSAAARDTWAVDVQAIWGIVTFIPAWLERQTSTRGSPTIQKKS